MAFAAVLLRALARTWRVSVPPWPAEGPVVVALLHGELLPMILLHRDRGLVGMVSHSRDGEWVAALLSRLGYGVIRGSSSRGGGEALLLSVAALREGRCPALAVDGPRGPAGRVQPGAEALAGAEGVPVVLGRLTGAGWRARSWDRFLVPWPFSRVRVVYATWRPGGGTLAEAFDRLDETIRRPSAT